MDQIRRVSDSEFKVALLTFTFREGDFYVVFSPSLDLTGYGEDKKGALESFTVVLEEFLKYSLKGNKLAENLLSLGWNFEEDEHPGELDHGIYCKDKTFISSLAEAEYSVYQEELVLESN